MTSFLPTFINIGRSSTHKLHQTVYRNILRRHQQTRLNSNASPSTIRNASTSTSTSTTAPPPQTIPIPGWPWITTPFRAYSAMQSRRPLLTQLESTLVIYFLGDLSAQTVATASFTTGSYEPIRGLKALAIASILSLPSYAWFMFLGRHFNFPGRHWLSIGVKILVNQLAFTPVFSTCFFGLQSLLSGGSLRESARRVRETVPISWTNSWKIWPLVTAVSFTWVPARNRSVFAGAFGVGWQTYLSWLNKNAEAVEGGGQKAGKGVTAAKA
ncbi:hypothetical protein BAUCODRAFT_34427 [Baudoinia panamericana UAMH 10762]|uniref:Mpv17/PMP22 family protein n=1 Tax=Baudoinia panamericana (strain UAMH 10762) TaxID=717646 RepID=M2MVR4_BAUPA|nr:uncharacterized protein BAUCODRAFT_34427 [Baudoinia panamericana UAMH 10762]EMC95658.1 hypothetical protein BAUCODRAFT_34427 [Baudoinia panamericana UAMH 10762]